jgi:hypothetical protein
MFPPRSLSSYLVCGGVVAVLAITMLETSRSLTTVDQFPPRDSQAIVDHGFSKVPAADVNRSRKGDRLPMALAQPVTHITNIPKNPVLLGQPVRDACDTPAPRTSDTPARTKNLEIDDGNPLPKLAPAPALDCEMMSVDSDGRFMGRCVV